MSCPNCAAGEVLPGEPIGSLSTAGAYLSQAHGSDQPSKTAIIILTDVFGLPLKNCKIIADWISAELKCDVWVPDYFAGWPILPLSRLSDIDHGGKSLTTWDWVRFYWSLIPRIPAFIYSRPTVADRRITKFINMILGERKYEKIGAVGYCYGGSAAIRLSATDLVQSIVICHPGKFTIAQAKAIKTPAAWDPFLPPSYRLETEAAFSERKGTGKFVDYEFEIYKGTIHGFAIRPNLAKPGDKEAYEKSLTQISAWFSKTLLI